MKKYLPKILFLISLVTLAIVPSQSQEKSKITPYFQLQYFKVNDQEAYLKSTLSYSMNRMEIPLPGMIISFFAGEAGNEPLASVITDEKGVAKVALGSDTKLPLNGDGAWSFRSEFKGNDTIDGADSELAIRNVTLEMTLSEVDSIKKIGLKAYTLQNGKEVPASEEAVNVYVPRMFSLLPVGEASLDENGTATIDFPSDIPGDEKGNITVIARFEENPNFGNIEKSVTEKWGIPTSYSVPTTHRALWTKTPPMWMIITLSILLAGVWGHYFFAIISLILIKIDAKRKKDKDEFLA